MVEFYLLTFPRFPLRKKEHKSYFGKNRTHDFRTSRCAAYLLDHSGDELPHSHIPGICYQYDILKVTYNGKSNPWIKKRAPQPPSSGGSGFGIVWYSRWSSFFPRFHNGYMGHHALPFAKNLCVTDGRVAVRVFSRGQQQPSEPG